MAAGGAVGVRAREGGYRILRYFVGLLLLAAAGLKAHELLAYPVGGGHFLDSPFVVAVAVAGELVLGGWLIVGIYREWSWCIAVLSFIAFTGVTLHRILIGAESCGCFGRIVVNPRFTIALDLSILGVLLVFSPGRENQRPFSRWNKALWRETRRFLAVAGCLLIAIGGILLPFYSATSGMDKLIAKPDISVEILSPETWLGKPFPLAEHIDIGAQLSRGEWLVVFYREDCPACEQLLDALSGMADEGVSFDRLALVAIQDSLVRSDSIGLGPAGCLSGRLDRTRDWILATPVAITVSGGVVLKSYTSDEIRSGSPANWVERD